MLHLQFVFLALAASTRPPRMQRPAFHAKPPARQAKNSPDLVPPPLIHLVQHAAQERLKTLRYSTVCRVAIPVPWVCNRACLVTLLTIEYVRPAELPRSRMLSTILPARAALPRAPLVYTSMLPAQQRLTVVSLKTWFLLFE
jgi:hypothetical protein